MVECSNDKIVSQVLKAVSDTTDKLVFTWESQYSVDDNSTVTLNFTEIDDNKTNISLSHVKFIAEKARSGHEEGWSNILDKLNEIMS
jgi:hypothetical protein